jgi:hypothetical protein
MLSHAPAPALPFALGAAQGQAANRHARERTHIMRFHRDERPNIHMQLTPLGMHVGARLMWRR